IRGGVVDRVMVTQSPPSVTVTEGDTVHIQCCWNLNMTKGKVNWLKESTQIEEDSSYNGIIVHNSPCLIGISKQTAACNCSNTIISNITRKDSGTCIFKVTIEIPQLFQSVGNGTHLTVTSKNDTSNGEYQFETLTIPTLAHDTSFQPSEGEEALCPLHNCVGVCGPC
uniref:Immunoglobulin V-set domain-containing protein n=1 Tax=Oncorhynchus mykiss TaxID=8022 RepID=A0A8C7PJ83_ONCMY